MANSFWNFVTSFVPGTLAKAEDVNTQFDGVAAGFDSVETEINKAIQVTSSPGTTDIPQNAASRALKLIQFNSSGDVELGTVVGDYQGDHADVAGTDYYVRDVVKDAAAALGLNNLYICNTAHTSTGDLLADTANWDLLVDVTDAVTAQVAAELAETNAETAQAAAEVAQAAAELAAIDTAASATFTTTATPTVFNAKNVASVVRGSVGIYNITLTNAMASLGYGILVSCSADASAVGYHIAYVDYPKTTTVFTIYVTDSTFNLSDNGYSVTFQVIGPLA